MARKLRSLIACAEKKHEELVNRTLAALLSNGCICSFVGLALSFRFEILLSRKLNFSLLQKNKTTDG